MKEETCDSCGNKVLEEVGMQVEDSMGSYHIADTHIEEVVLVDSDCEICERCKRGDVCIERIDPKNDLYLEPINFDFDDVTSTASTAYMFQEAINNIIKVLNKITTPPQQ
jgi:hypothetical protein